MQNKRRVNGLDIKDYAKTFQLKIDLGLSRIKLLLEKLGSPEKNIRLIHISGTNGKGSVCAFLEQMLIHSGARVGLYSSPELYKKNEVIRINGENIPENALDELIDSVSNACSEVENEIGQMPSQFEILTACAFLHFKNKNTEYVIMEVGMGGEGDATNVCSYAEIAIITKIGLDHTAYLGSDIFEITKAKCGIIKKGCTVITPEANIPVREVIAAKCDEKGADLQVTTRFTSCGFDGIYEKVRYLGDDITLSLGGIAQTENAALAVRAAIELGIDDESIIYGLTNAIHKGRFEKISDGFYFDGAHNPDGAEVLKKNIDRYFENKKIIYIFGSMKDKDISTTLKILKGKTAEFYFVTVDTPGRAMPATEILRIGKKLKLKCVAFEKLCNAYKKAKEKQDKNTVILACGSLYFYKDFKNEGIF